MTAMLNPAIFLLAALLLLGSRAGGFAVHA